MSSVGAASKTSWWYSQNLPCSSAQADASAAGRASLWPSSGKWRYTSRTCSGYFASTCFSAPSARLQNGHW